MTQGAKSHTLELKADGTLVADGKPVGKITGAEMDDSNGKMIAAVQGDNTIKFDTAGGTQTGVPKFNDKDAIEVDGKVAISIADDGTVTVMGADGKPDTKGKMKFAGFKPTARRTACLLVFGMFIPSKATSTVTAVSASPAVSAAPAKK